jgi:hypothetical protein
MTLEKRPRVTPGDWTTRSTALAAAAQHPPREVQVARAPDGTSLWWAVWPSDRPGRWLVLSLTLHADEVRAGLLEPALPSARVEHLRELLRGTAGRLAPADLDALREAWQQATRGRHALSAPLQQACRVLLDEAPAQS